MRDWRVHALGDPAEVLQFDEVDPPEPGPGQVRVGVAAAGLNFPDLLMIAGRYQDAHRCRSPQAWRWPAS